MDRRWWRAGAVALAAFAGAVGLPLPDAVAAHAVPAPTLSDPPPGQRGHALWDSFFDLAAHGYEEAEHFVSGTTQDGTEFTTRIIVTRPTDADDFNGTVLLDWVNVTAQFENAVDTLEAREMLLREGFAWVHMSVQAVGLCCSPLTPKSWDPVRYAAIDHPGDQYAFEIFSQIAQAFRNPTDGNDPMGSLGSAAVERVLVAGQSQSAIRLRAYVNDWLPDHPEAIGLVDGFLIHGDVNEPKAFAAELPVKVLHLLSDLEAVDDGFDPTGIANYRLWEVAGTGHSDYFIGHQSVFGHGPRVLLGAPKQSAAAYDALLDAAGNYGERLDPELATCIVAGSTMPMHYAASTAIHRLDAWVRGTDNPGNGPRFTFEGGAQALDEHGNPLGGIRLPPIDVPVARYRSTACGLGGMTIPFTDAELVARYGTHASYYAQMAAATDQAVADGWLLPEDAGDLMRRACDARRRFPLAPPACTPYAPPPFGEPLPADGPAPSAAGGGVALRSLR